MHRYKTQHVARQSSWSIKPRSIYDLGSSKPKSASTPLWKARRILSPIKWSGPQPANALYRECSPSHRYIWSRAHRQPWCPSLSVMMMMTDWFWWISQSPHMTLIKTIETFRDKLAPHTINRLRTNKKTALHGRSPIGRWERTRRSSAIPNTLSIQVERPFSSQWLLNYKWLRHISDDAVVTWARACTTYKMYMRFIAYVKIVVVAYGRLGNEPNLRQYNLHVHRRQIESIANIYIFAPSRLGN